MGTDNRNEGAHRIVPRHKAASAWPASAAREYAVAAAVKSIPKLSGATAVRQQHVCCSAGRIDVWAWHGAELVALHSLWLHSLHVTLRALRVSCCIRSIVSVSLEAFAMRHGMNRLHSQVRSGVCRRVFIAHVCVSVR